MDLTKTKEKLKQLIDENTNEEALKEVRNILELSSETSFVLSPEQKSELDELERQYDAGKLKTYSWEEVKQQLFKKLQK